MVKIAYFAAVIETKKWPFLDFSFKEWKNTFCGIFGFINCSCIYDFYLLRWNRMNGITRLENYWFFRSIYCKFTSYYRNIWSHKKISNMDIFVTLPKHSLSQIVICAFNHCLGSVTGAIRTKTKAFRISELNKK